MLFAGIAFVLLIYAFERSFRKRKKADSDELFELSRLMRCSEHEIFRMAGKNWNVPESRIKEYFKGYLFYNDIPFYVRNYIRRQGTENNNPVP